MEEALPRHFGNVVGLMEVPTSSTPSQISDAQHIINVLGGLGYWARWFRFDAREYGSSAACECIYLIAVCGFVDDSAAGPFVVELLAALKHDPLPPERFVCMSEHDLISTKQTYNLLGMKAKQKASEATAFRDDHFELFRLAGFEWPVQVGSLRGAYYRIPLRIALGKGYSKRFSFWIEPSPRRHRSSLSM